MIEWISVNDETPKMHEEKDDDGRIYHVSNIILCWNGDEEEPIAAGVFEDGKFFANGVSQPNVTHWAYINRPESAEEKQVILSGDGMWDGQIAYDMGECPTCGKTFELDDDNWEEPFCNHCGTKLHWFDNEKENRDGQ